MITIRRRAGQAFLVASVTLMMLVVAAPAWARTAPPERLVGDTSTGGGAATLPTDPVSQGTPIWQFVLVAVIAATAAVALAAMANRTVLHRHYVAH